MSLQLAAALYIYTHYALKKKRKERQWWQTQTQPYTSREVYSGSSLLVNLNFQSVSGLYKIFTRMFPSEFEFLINMTGEKISKKHTAFRKAISVQETLALTLRFLASGDSYVSLQYFFEISWVHSISQLPRRSRNHTAQQIRTTVQDRSTRNEKKGRGADVGYVTCHVARPHLLRP